MRTDPLGLALLAIARNAIEKQFGRSAVVPVVWTVTGEE